MRADEIEDVFTSGDFEQVFATQEDFAPGAVVDHDHYLEISGVGAFPVYAISSKSSRDTKSIDVNHEDGRDLGQLLLIKGTKLDSFYDLSAAEFLAYLADVPRDKFGELGYIFSNDFLVTSDVGALEYDGELRATSDLWGGFSHYPHQPSPVKPFISIGANSKISVPSEHHSEAFARYTYAQNPFERFLRLYHCVELLFDTITVLKIKKLTADIRGLSQILSSHGGKEVDRLIAISNEFIYDHELLAQNLIKVSGYQALAKKVFDDHSKDGNPIAPSANPPRWTSVVSNLSAGRFTESDLKSNGALKEKEDYKAFISKLSAYWIYRVRCSIAHSRIGEFILTNSDAGFVEDFAEPLLLEFCSQIFSSQALKDLL